MAVVAALPVASEFVPLGGFAFTFILPAKKCDLACPACYISARNEVSKNEVALPVEAFVSIAQAASRLAPGAKFAIQGYEPLLPETWPYTEALLTELQRQNAIRALITNGTNLAQRAHQLEGLEPSLLTVSIDSHRSELHDLTRGVQGAYFRTRQGLSKALLSNHLRSHTMVASMLQPKRHHYLFGMAAWLAKTGVSNWVVTPVLNPQKQQFVEEPTAIVASLAKLTREARDCGIELFLDDEFSMLDLQSFVDPSELPKTIRRIERLENTVRISPSGRTSVGVEILGPSSDAFPRWLPAEESADQFLARILQ